MKITVSCIIMLFASVTAELTACAGEPPPFLCEILPGGTHFHDGNPFKGTAFALTETALFAGGLALKSRRDDEYNVPLLLSGQIYTIDKCDYSRQRLAAYLANNYPHGAVTCDISPLGELMTAPFGKDTILSPFVITWALLGIVDGIIAYPDREGKWNDIGSVRLFERDMSRSRGTVAYGISGGTLSWGAAVSEEMLFRGLFLPALDSRYGRRAGLVSSSLVFGALHLFNSGIDRPVYFFGQATVAGFVFGRHVQKNDYRLKKAIAAHFWYNAVSMATTWALNPEENPLGFGISMAF